MDRDLSGAVRSRVREELVRTEVRTCELPGVTPSEAAIPQDVHVASFMRAPLLGYIVAAGFLPVLSRA